MLLLRVGWNISKSKKVLLVPSGIWELRNILITDSCLEVSLFSWVSPYRLLGTMLPVNHSILTACGVLPHEICSKHATFSHAAEGTWSLVLRHLLLVTYLCFEIYLTGITRKHIRLLEFGLESVKSNVSCVVAPYCFRFYFKKIFLQLDCCWSQQTTNMGSRVVLKGRAPASSCLRILSNLKYDLMLCEKN